MIIVDINTICDIIQKCRICKRKKKTDTLLPIDCISAFDIETTRIKNIEQSVMYVWQWAFQIKKNETYVLIGRTWSEFIDCARKIHTSLCGYKLIVFIHNLSYEFQFLSGIYSFKSEDVFAVKSRKVLKAVMLDLIEFRCSYLLTNMSLDMFTEKMEVEHRKLSGQKFDYDKLRYPWTSLSDYELDYCINDVVGLCEAIKILNSIHNDTLVTMPLTSTGYVRRDMRTAMYAIKKKQ